MKICWGLGMGRKTDLPAFSVLQKSYFTVFAVRNACVLAWLSLIYTSSPKVTYSSKVLGPNRAKNSCQSCTPVTPMLPGEPPRGYA